MITDKQLHVLGKFLDRPLQLVGGNTDVPILKENSLNVQGYISIAKHITRTSKQHALLGKTPTEKALVDQWLEYVSLHLQDNSETASNLQELNQFLADRVYILGHFVSLADMLLYFTLHETFSELTFYDKEKYSHVSRWFDNEINTLTLLRRDLRDQVDQVDTANPVTALNDPQRVDKP